MKKIMIAMFSCFCIMLGLSGCMSGSQEFTDADKDAIAKIATEAVAAFNSTKDYNAYVNAYYDEQAEVLMPNFETVRGREAIVTFLKSFGDLKLEFKTNKIEGKGDLAYVVGEYFLSFPNGMSDHGKYIEIWKKKEGAWHIIHDISNSSVPMQADSVKM